MAFPNRCVNCTITFDNPRIVCREVLQLDSPLPDLLQSWTSMEILSEHRVCEECIIVLQSQVQVDEHTRSFGHKSVCLGCGVSVLRARSIRIDQSRQEYAIIKSWGPQIQADLPIFTRVCRPCWRRATRAQASNVAHIKREVDHELLNVKVELEDTVEIPSHASNGVQVSGPLTPPSLPTPVLDQNDVQCPEPNTSIALHNYKRVSSTSRRCIFSGCLNLEQIFLSIPFIIRRRILIDFKIYIPQCSRICSNHLFFNKDEWSNLVNESLVNSFTSEHIEDMLFLNQYNLDTH